MEEIRIVKVVDDGIYSSSIGKYRAIVEWYIDGEIEFAEPISTLEELFLALGNTIVVTRIIR